MQLFIIVTVVVSLLLGLIGVSTQHWYQSLSNEFHEGLWLSCRTKLYSDICYKQPYMKSQGLAVSALVFLLISLILTIIKHYRNNDIRLTYLILVTLTTSTLLLIFSYLIYPRQFNLKQFGYSIYFMLFSSLFTFISTVLVALTVRKIRTTSTEI